MWINKICILSFLMVLPAYAGDNQKEVSLLKSKISEYEGVVRTKLNILNTCRNQCTLNCSNACPFPNDDGTYNVGGGWTFTPDAEQSPRENCLKNCTNAKCDAGECSAQRAEYDKYKGHLDSYKENLADLEKQLGEKEGDNESVVKQIKRAKKKTNTMAYLGAATTAFLTYKAAACCSKTGCSMCPAWVTMAGLAALQTKNMFNQRDKFGATQMALCEQNSSEAACGSDSPNGGDPLPDPPESCKTNPDLECEKIVKIIEDDSKNKGNNNNQPGQLPGVCAGSNCFTGSKLTSKLLDVYKPDKKKWPHHVKKALENGTPFDKQWLDENVPPQHKKHINKMLGNLRNQNKDYLAKAGIAGDGSDFGSDTLSDEGAGASAASAGAANKDSNAFSGSKDSGSSSAYAGNESGRSLSGRKKNSLARQMEDMMKKLYGGKGGGSALKEKSVSFGDDIVGVLEDNIFMMVHRRHRNLDEERKAFIRSGF